MDSIELADGGLLLYEEAFLPANLAARYFVELRDTASWEQKKAAFGHWQPRLTASYGDEGVTYFYSGTENAPLAIPDWAGGEPDYPGPSPLATTAAPDQATQLRYAAKTHVPERPDGEPNRWPDDHDPGPEPAEALPFGYSAAR